MNHQDHVRLIAPGVPARSGGVWADLGAGDGAFTLALREITGPDVTLYAVDRDRSALSALRAAMDRTFPDTQLHTIRADMTEPLALPTLDGIVIANALHYVADQPRFLRSLPARMAPASRLIVVEYDSDQGNRWVPHAVSANTFVALARDAGFQSPTVIGRVPSRFLGSIYAAIARTPAAPATATSN